MTRKNRSSGQRRPPAAWRPRVLFGTLVFLSVAIAARLFVLQIFDADFYQALASDQHSLFQEFFPKRGRIFVHDGKGGRMVALAANEQRAFVYADPRLLSDPASTAKRIGEVLGLGEGTIAENFGARGKGYRLCLGICSLLSGTKHKWSCLGFCGGGRRWNVSREIRHRRSV